MNNWVLVTRPHSIIPESSNPHNCCFEGFKAQKLGTLHIIIELLERKT
jgi:hypothetical protein